MFQGQSRQFHPFSIDGILSNHKAKTCETSSNTKIDECNFHCSTKVEQRHLYEATGESPKKRSRSEESDEENERHKPSEDDEYLSKTLYLFFKKIKAICMYLFVKNPVNKNITRTLPTHENVEIITISKLQS